jgi:hypothetical protein
MSNSLPTEQEHEKDRKRTFFRSRTVTRAKLAGEDEIYDPSNKRRDISVRTGKKSRRWRARLSGERNF